MTTVATARLRAAVSAAQVRRRRAIASRARPGAIGGRAEGASSLPPALLTRRVFALTGLDARSARQSEGSRVQTGALTRFDNPGLTAPNGPKSDRHRRGSRRRVKAGQRVRGQSEVPFQADKLVVSRASEDEWRKALPALPVNGRRA